MVSQRRQESIDEYEVVREADVMVPMRDGTRLATDIYFPARRGRPIAGPLPAIMERTPYDKERPQNVQTAEYFARRGYAVVYQDVRGRYKSEGRFVKYLDDPDDGYDAVEWIAERPWSSGKVGTFGLSYGAHTQASLGV